MFSKSEYKINDLLNTVKEYDLDPPYQRSSNAWETDRKINLLNSMLKGYPIPPIFAFKTKKDSQYRVIDGKQRLTALREFFDEESEWKIDKINLIQFRCFDNLLVDMTSEVIAMNGECFSLKTGTETSDSNASFCTPNIYQLKYIMDRLERLYDVKSTTIKGLSGDLTRVIGKLYTFEFVLRYESEGNEDDETILFGYLNAGEPLTFSEVLNYQYWNYGIWRDAKKLKSRSESRYSKQKEVIFKAFKNKDRFLDVQLFGDLLLTIFKNPLENASIGNINIEIYRWEKDFTKVERNVCVGDTVIEHCCDLLPLVADYVNSLNHQSKKASYKLLIALYLFVYYVHTIKGNAFNCLSLGGANGKAICGYMNNSALDQKNCQTIFNDMAVIIGLMKKNNKKY